MGSIGDTLTGRRENKMSYEKEAEVYQYVKANASEYLAVIVRALTDGVNEENEKLRDGKSKVECGLLLLADRVKLSKVKTNMRTTLVEALKACTFLRVDSFIEAIEAVEKGDKDGSR